jgi:glutathione S-transferase
MATESAPVPVATETAPTAAPIEAPTEAVIESTPTEPKTEPETEPATKTEEAAPNGIIVHHLEHSRSQRLLWLLEELEVPYTLKVYKRIGGRAPPELEKISPLGKIPIITDGDLTILESAVIMEYIIEKFGNGKALPPPSGKLTDRYYSHYAEGSLMPLLGIRAVTGFLPAKAPFLIRPVAKGLVQALDANYTSPELKKHLEMIEKHLAGCPTGWFAGGENPTLADFMMSMPLEAIAATSHGKTEKLGPATAAFVKKCHARPAYLRALEKGEVDYHYGPKHSKL